MIAAVPATAFDKMWELHAIARVADGRTLLHVDRHLTHELTSPRAYAGLQSKGRTVARPELTLAVEEHVLSTEPGRSHDTYAAGTPFIVAQRAHAERSRVPLVDVGHPSQGIVHVMAAELGIVMPGTTAVCGDSHTCTLGGLGAVAFGIGTSDIEHVLTTQTLVMARPQAMRVTFEGAQGAAVDAKDLSLHLVRTIGVRGATGYAIEYAGSTVRRMPVEERQTLCNMSIEAGARIGFVAADDTTFDYLRGRPGAPPDSMWAAAVAHWRTLASDPGAAFAREVDVDVTKVGPQVTWGTMPSQALAIGERVPDPDDHADEEGRSLARRALAYMGLTPGTPIAGVPVDVVFIGSCNGSRLRDLRNAARVVAGRRVAPGVRALVVPGSSRIRREAEAEGLDVVLRDAGFEWRESACSMCAAVNADVVPPGARCIATTNRNFEGRQGRGARTHLASAITAASAAIAGCIVDPREFLH